MLEFILYFMLLHIFTPTKQIKLIIELEIPQFMQFLWTFSNMHIVAALSGSPVVTLDRTQTGIRHTVSLQAELVYKDNLWIGTSVKINYCTIFRCTTSLQTLVIIRKTHLLKIPYEYNVVETISMPMCKGRVVYLT